jgi:hypothetical protein
MYKGKKLDAEKTLNVGEYPFKQKGAGVAALMKVIDLIYNMEEAITKT